MLLTNLSEMNWYICLASKPKGLMSGSKILQKTDFNSVNSSRGTSKFFFFKDKSQLCLPYENVTLVDEQGLF